MRITVVNRGPEAASLHVLPTVWFRNTWSWSVDEPSARACSARPPWAPPPCSRPTRRSYGTRYVCFEGTPPLLFTENDTNTRKLFGIDGPAVRQGRHQRPSSSHGSRGRHQSRRLVARKPPRHYVLDVPPAASAVVRVRFTHRRACPSRALRGLRRRVSPRAVRRGRLLRHRHPGGPLGRRAAQVMRQAFAGLLWNQQFYHFDVKTWLDGDPGHPRPPPSAAREAATQTGGTCTTTTSSRCRTSGSIRGTRPGTSPSTACRSPSSTRSSPSVSCC